MDLMPASPAFALAAACAGLMGYAIQRGGTCTVAAVEELVHKRSARRLLGMAEAALWVAGGLVLAQALHLLPHLPAAYAVSAWTVAGGALLGLGAWINRACVFGAIARLGNGEWAYAATPLGFYLGCLSVGWFPAPRPRPLAQVSPVLQASALLALAFAAWAAWRLLRPAWHLTRTEGRAGWARRLAAAVWEPHAATCVIGITFVVLMLLAGTWAYTDTLAAAAHGMATSVATQLILLLVLYAGGVLGGWTAGRLRGLAPSPGQLLRCLAGGLLMGWGSLLIPGSNDGMILVGMPLLRGYAWVGFGTMCLVIAAALVLPQALRRVRPIFTF
ncbi:MAG: YeeE/YedE family protein [Aquabacterium sp.]|nr:MAG: YeeE/YedE family protein [Aquabacterium sp.]